MLTAVFGPSALLTLPVLAVFRPLVLRCSQDSSTKCMLSSMKHTFEHQCKNSPRMYENSPRMYDVSPAGWVDNGSTREIRVDWAVERVVRRTVERILVEALLRHDTLWVVQIVAAAHKELEMPLEHQVRCKANAAAGCGNGARVRTVSDRSSFL